MWSTIAAKNASKPVKKPNPDLKLPKNNNKKVEEKPDYWDDPKFDCGWKTIEAQVKDSYKKAGQEVPMEIYGRPGLLDKYKN